MLGDIIKHVSVFIETNIVLINTNNQLGETNVLNTQFTLKCYPLSNVAKTIINMSKT